MAPILGLLPALLLTGCDDRFYGFGDRTLVVQVEGAGRVDPGGGEFTFGSTVMLLATPAAGFVLEGWNGPDAGGLRPVAEDQWEIVLDRDREVTAVFAARPSPDSATLVVAIEPAGAGAVEPAGGRFEVGYRVALTVLPDSGYVFGHWAGADADYVSTAGDDSWEIVMVGDRALTAVFEPAPPEDPVTLAVTIDPEEGGTTDPSAGTYERGSTVVLAVRYSDGHAFGGWTGPDAEDLTAVAAGEWEILMDSDKVLNATFVARVASDTLRVPQDYFTVQEALDAAMDGTVVIVSPGTYRERLNFRGKGIELRSMDPADPEVVEATILDGDGRGSVVTLASGEPVTATLAGFTIQGGTGRPIEGVTHGGGVFIHRGAAPTIERSLIRDNDASRGGGIFVGGEATPVIRGNRITGHWGAANDPSRPDFRVDNTHTIFAHGAAPTVEDNIITDNRDGIRVSLASGPVSITGNHIHTNQGRSLGIGIYVADSEEIVVAGNIIVGNHPTIPHENINGCGVAAENVTSLVIANNTISDNFSTGGIGGGGQGGGVYVDGSALLEIAGNVITDNAVRGRGGGIHIRDSEDVVLTGNQLDGNTAHSGNGTRGEGGGLYLWSVVAVVVGNEFSHNHADAAGGAVWLSTDASLRDDAGEPLADPDTLNTYVSNVPNDIHRH